MRLLTNNPRKSAALVEHGIAVAAREPLVSPVHADNETYLRTKQERMGHRFEPD